MLRPLAEAGLIIGCHLGNHEARLIKDTSVNLIKIIRSILFILIIFSMGAFKKVIKLIV